METLGRHQSDHAGDSVIDGSQSEIASTGLVQSRMLHCEKAKSTLTIMYIILVIWILHWRQFRPQFIQITISTSFVLFI